MSKEEAGPAKTEPADHTETIQAFQSKTAIMSPSRTSGPSGLDKVFSFQRHSSVEFGFRESIVQRLAWRVVTNMVFESASMFMLIANSIAIGIQTDYVASNMVSTVPAYLRALDIVFCIFFALELSVRLTAFGRRFFTMTGCGWNVLDLILVSSQVAEEILFAVAMHTGGGTVQYNTNDAYCSHPTGDQGCATCWCSSFCTGFATSDQLPVPLFEAIPVVGPLIAVGHLCGGDLHHTGCHRVPA